MISALVLELSLTLLPDQLAPLPPCTCSANLCASVFLYVTWCWSKLLTGKHLFPLPLYGLHPVAAGSHRGLQLLDEPGSLTEALAWPTPMVPRPVQSWQLRGLQVGSF